MAGLHVYEVIRRPIVTEKSSALTEDAGKYVFEVAKTANKIQIREAVELIFDVKVDKVNTLIVPPKRGRRGRKWYMRTKAWKKAIVTLLPGQTIELFDV
ncbi:MAG: 50S ribosomal protein L23 [Chloroflexi bacterium AL-W]|nr:50S ribosomal protein L23 [Chloroflexi bacterium AL-W]